MTDLFDAGPAVPLASPLGSGVSPNVVADAEKLKEAGNQAFTKFRMLARTTAGKQFLYEAKVCYIDAIKSLSTALADERTLALVATLHTNLTAVHLHETPPRYELARATAEIALQVNPRQVKALFRRAQAILEDERPGLPEAAWRESLASLQSALELEPNNTQVSREVLRVQRKLEALQDAQRIPEPDEIARKIPAALLHLGSNLLVQHGYLWGQTDELVHVFVPARGVRFGKSSDVAVEVKATSLSICLLAKEGETFELSGELQKPVRPDESSWQISDSGLLIHVELAKHINDDKHQRHFERVWREHLTCRIASLEEREALRQLNEAAKLPEPVEAQPPNEKAAETLRKIRQMCPGVDVQWGDTSFAEYD